MSDEKDDKWEMPKPVFRTTSGALPKTFEKTISQSFSPNKANEIDYDDDILSLHDTPSMNKSEGRSAVHDHEVITETPDTADSLAPDAASVTDEDQVNPVVLIEKEQIEDAGANPRSDFLIYLMIAIIGVALIIAALFRSPS